MEATDTNPSIVSGTNSAVTQSPRGPRGNPCHKWCGEHGVADVPAIPAWCKCLPPPGSDTPVRSRTAIDRLITRRDVHLREKTFYRMLYETAARSEEILTGQHRGP